MFRKTCITSAVAVIVCAVSFPAQAIFIGNIQGGTDFPQGAISFADSVVSFTPAGPPSDPHLGAFNALDIPDYVGINSCASQADCSFVSLGNGGSIVLSFDDNKLTGSGDNALDIWIFEVGPNIEDTYVDISKDGVNWFSVGKVFGSTAGIDIDSFGFTVTDQFGFVRLTDDVNEGGGGVGGTVGADIDAVGAISTIHTVVPVPAAFWLFGSGLLGLLGLCRKR